MCEEKMSLAKLRDKLSQLSRRNPADDVGHFDISEQNTYLQKISQQGNRPEDWIEYIELMKKEVPMSDKITKHNIICELYEKAFKDINSEVYRTHEAYANLFVDFARYKSVYCVEDARQILSQARTQVRKLAVVHIAAAQVEVDAGDSCKAKKILEKAMLFEARPVEDLREAVKRLQERNPQLRTLPSHTDKQHERLPARSEASTEADVRPGPAGHLSHSQPPPPTRENSASKLSSGNLRDKFSQLCRLEGDTFTFDISEQNTQLQKIAEQGNRPEDWLEYIDLVKTEVPFPDKPSRHNFFCELYEKAFKEINSDQYRSHEAYAVLFVGYGRLKSEYSSEDARMIFSQARSIVRKFAIVHLASAQLELDLDDKPKAKKILEKAILFDAKPANDLKGALNRLKEGTSQLYISPSKPGKKQDSPASVRSDSLTDAKPVADGNVQSHDHPDAPSCSKMHKSVSGDALNARPPLVNTDRVSRLGLRVFHSTPLLNSEKRRSREQNLPLRVKKASLPFSELPEHEEEQENTMDSFKPLEPVANSTYGYTNAHTSGYLSMTQTDITSPLDTRPPTVPQIQEEKMHVDTIELEKEKNRPKPPMFSHLAEKVSNKPVPMPQPQLQHQPPLPPQSEPQPPVNRNQGPVLPPEPLPLSHQPSVMSTPCMKGLHPDPSSLRPPSTPMSNMKLITVNGVQYGVLGVIGKGGSSKVYRVFDSQYTLKAVKCVNLDNANDIIVEGYKNEIRLLERLQYCDKVIKMYDSEYRADENKLYVVMEVGSEDLAAFFRSQTKDGKGLSSNLIRFYWEVMLQAVQALHREGIIHSDLKPANFLLVGGNLKLIDFGIAKALQQDKTSLILETQIGTLNFMSPETVVDSCGDDPNEVKGKPKFKIGVKSDVWSLGCILYNMVYGRTPFGHLRRDFLKLQAIINPDFPIEFPEIADKYLMDVMKRCLCRDPKERPSIEELLAHPYISVDATKAKSKKSPLIDKRVEALVSSLANHSALSPNGIRSLIQQTINTEQMTPEGPAGTKRKQEEDGLRADGMKAQPPVNPLAHKPVMNKKPGGPLTVKHARAPLQNLNLQGLHSSKQGQNNGCLDTGT